MSGFSVRNSVTSNPSAPVPDAGAPASKTRKRRLFGPLLYSTLFFALICVAYLAALKLQLGTSREIHAANARGPEAEIEDALTQLSSGNASSRVAGANILSGLLQRTGIGEDQASLRNTAVSALRRALGDPVTAVREATASALGGSKQVAQLAETELNKALEDESMEVRLKAAQALVLVDTESKSRAFRMLADIAIEGPTEDDRYTSLSLLAKQGREGQTAAVAVFVRRLSNADAPIGHGIVNCALLFDDELLVPAVEPLLNSNDSRQRTAAALAIVRGEIPGWSGPRMGFVPPTPPASIATLKLPKALRQSIIILEKVVCDTDLDFGVRESAMLTLSSTGPRNAVHRCGIKLARQLEDPDGSIRYSAAKLLHLIDPATLSGSNIPEETP